MVDFSLKNRKIAINRWKTIFDNKSRLIIKNNLKYPHLKTRILGYLMGDGSVTIREEKEGTIHHSVHFYSDDERMLKSFLYAFKKIYEVSPLIRKDEQYFRVRIDSKPITLDLLSYGSFRSLEWQVPKDLFISDLTKKEWLRAFYDSEGYVGPNVIAIQSVNKKGLSQIQELLQSYNIDNKMYSYKRQNQNWNTNFLLYITKKESRRKFLKEIGFNHRKKQKKLIASVA